MNKDNVPEALVPFLPVVQKWGAITSDSERYALRDKAEEDPQELKELEDFFNAWTPEHDKAYSEWGENLSLSQNKTLARFYFTFMLCDELGFKPPVDENADHVGALIEELMHVKEGARARAAFDLPKHGDDARRAIPSLQKNLDDPVPEVRISAHYALARIVGNVDEHRDAIRQIGEGNPECRLAADGILEKLDRTPEQHNIEALCSFCITNKVREIRRLVAICDVNGVDHNGARPLGYSVGNDHKEAVRVLLEHGADPNIKNKWGEPCLHRAAVARDNLEIISLLIEHGADVNATDKHGRTPLDRAIENRRRSNAELLSKFGAKRGDGGEA